MFHGAFRQDRPPDLGRCQGKPEPRALWLWQEGSPGQHRHPKGVHRHRAVCYRLRNRPQPDQLQIKKEYHMQVVKAIDYLPMSLTIFLSS